MTYIPRGVEVTKKVTNKLLIYKAYLAFDTFLLFYFETALTIIIKSENSIYICFFIWGKNTHA